MRATFLLFLLILVTGCTKTIYVTKTEYLYPDDAWVAHVASEPPPADTKFAAMSIEDKLTSLGEAYMAQTNNLGVCNAQLDKTRQWKTTHLLKEENK